MNKNIGSSYLEPENGGSSIKRISVPYYWRGGTFGAEYDWNEPMNWYNRFVPGWFDTVVISEKATNSFHYPEIHDFSNDIAQLIIEDGGKLTIGREGKLCVDGLAKKGLGIINEGELLIVGEMTVHRTLRACVRNKGLIYNCGSFAIDRDGENGIIQLQPGRFENLGEFLSL